MSKNKMGHCFCPATVFRHRNVQYYTVDIALYSSFRSSHNNSTSVFQFYMCVSVSPSPLFNTVTEKGCLRFYKLLNNFSAHCAQDSETALRSLYRC